MLLRRLAVSLTALVAVLAGTATPALAYPVYPLWDAFGRVGSAHIERVSGKTWDIAVADERVNGKRICVEIHSAVPGPLIYYCDKTSTAGNDGKASHYRISYPWYKADVCQMDSTLPCGQYIYKDPTE